LALIGVLKKFESGLFLRAPKRVEENFLSNSQNKSRALRIFSAEKVRRDPS
jgi:hypothetical protein